jgi:signal transduction histidine kinase
MPLPYQLHDPLRTASVLFPALFSLGDPDLLVEVLDSNPAGIVMVEAAPGLPVVYCNESFQRWVGGGIVNGRSLAQLFAWADRSALRATYDEAISSGLPIHRRAIPYHGPSGDQVHGYWSASHYPLRGPSGRVTHVLSVTVDVTEDTLSHALMRNAQQRVMEAVAQIARHFASRGPSPNGGTPALTTGSFDELGGTIADLVSADRLAFWLYDERTETLSPQPGAFGFSDEQLQLAGPVACHPDRDGVVESIVFRDRIVMDAVDANDPRASGFRALMDALQVSDVLAIPWKIGERRLGAVSAFDSARPAGFTEEDAWVLQAAAMASAVVWEHRQADAALTDLREREEAGLRHQIEQSIQLEQLKTEFLKVASHELRGPLGIVRGYISMMEDGTLGTVGQSVAPVLPLLRAKLEEMNQLINEILETARLEDSALELKVVQVDLRDVVAAAAHSLEPLATDRHTMRTTVGDQALIVRGDVSRLRIVVTNLIHNAIKYSPRGGEIAVYCEARDGQAVVSVTDHGIGIAEADLPRLFTRFGRIVNDETSELPGTGLGLYLARDLAHRHRGEIRVDSEPGRGSTFTLTLPLTPNQ